MTETNVEECSLAEVTTTLDCDQQQSVLKHIDLDFDSYMRDENDEENDLVAFTSPQTPTSPVELSSPTQSQTKEVSTSKFDVLDKFLAKDDVEYIKDTVVETLNKAKESVTALATKENVNKAQTIVVEKLTKAKDAVIELTTKESREKIKGEVTVALQDTRVKAGEALTTVQTSVASTYTSVKTSVESVATKENLELAKKKTGETLENVKTEILTSYQTVKGSMTKENLELAKQSVWGFFTDAKNTYNAIVEDMKGQNRSQ
jgi:hypothetical protein